MPLTVGDGSTVYQKPSNSPLSLVTMIILGRERSEVGKARNMVNNPCRGTRDTFERGLKSNAVGDAFVDPGQYFLRKPDSRKSESKDERRNSAAVFKYSGGPKLVRRSEFEHLHNGPPARPEIETRKNFLTRSTAERFQGKVPYTEDLYENKEDLMRQDYLKRRSLILTPNRPYTSTVRQRGTFYPQYMTYGTLKSFPEVSQRRDTVLSSMPIESDSQGLATCSWTVQGR